MGHGHLLEPSLTPGENKDRAVYKPIHEQSNQPMINPSSAGAPGEPVPSSGTPRGIGGTSRAGKCESRGHPRNAQGAG